MDHTFLAIIVIVYGVAFIPALRTAIAFWLNKDNSEVANIAMQNGFIMGLLKIWVIYPIYLIKDCINSLKGYKDE